MEAQLSQALYDFMLARAVMSEEAMEQALMVPARQVELKLGSRNIMSVAVPLHPGAVHCHNGWRHALRLCVYLGRVGRRDFDAGRSAARTVEAGRRPKSANMLADEIEKTRRRVNALEYVLIPQMEADIRTISMKMDENERGNLTRLMKTKDMLAGTRCVAAAQRINGRRMPTAFVCRFCMWSEKRARAIAQKQRRVCRALPVLQCGEENPGYCAISTVMAA